MPVRTTGVLVLLASKTVTSAVIGGSGIAVGRWIEGLVLISVTANDTSGVHDLDIETSDDQTDWHKLVDVTQINNPTVPADGRFEVDAVQLTNFGKFIRLNNPGGITSGTSLTLEALFIGKN